MIDKEFGYTSFTAYEGGRVTHLKQLKQRNVLITVGVRKFFFFPATKY
jgi:hypothetical protein